MNHVGWYALKVDGEIRRVMYWGLDAPPTILDINVYFSSDHDYEVVRVEIRELE